MLFFRLTGGRTDAASHTDEITVEGDAALAMQLASNLAFTI
jgi:ubiquinone biosynthesis protein UbiJ